MKALLALVLGAMYLSILWGPTYYLARRLNPAWHPARYHLLRFILPVQLVITGALLMAAESADIDNHAGLFVLITAAVSVAGAAVFLLVRLVTRRLHAK